MPAGHNDLVGVRENLEVRNAEFLYFFPNILGAQIPWQVLSAAARSEYKM